MPCFQLKLRFVFYNSLLFSPFFLVAQGQYLKVAVASEYVELHNLQFKETFNKSSFENPVYEVSPVHEKLFGMSFISINENKSFWEIGFLTGYNSKNNYYIPVSKVESKLYATEKVYYSQINFSKNMFRLYGENRNFSFGLCFNAGYSFNFNELRFSSDTGITSANLKKVINQISIGFFPKARLQLAEKLHIEINTLIHVFQIGNEYSKIGTYSTNILRLTNYGNLQFNLGMAYQIKGKSVFIK